MEPLTKLALGMQSSLAERWSRPQDFSEGSRRAQAECSSAVSCSDNRRMATAIAVLLCAMIASSPEVLFAQTSTATPSPTSAQPAEPDGVTVGGYQIHS